MTGPKTPRAFFAGLAGGLIAALLIAAMPTVTAAVGDAINLGEVNTGNAVTTVRGSSDATLRLGNQKAGAPALDLRVTSGSPPFKIDSGKKVARLNADKVDGRSANQLTRVASASTADAIEPPTGTGPLASATINAPTAGFLVMSGSVAVAGDALDLMQCRLAVAGDVGTGYYAYREVIVHDAGLQYTSNSHDVCATNAVATVAAGTYEVRLDIVNRNTASLKGADVWAIFVPFDGTGAAATSGW